MLKILSGNSVDEVMESKDFKDFEKQCDQYRKSIEREAREGLSLEESLWVTMWLSGKPMSWGLIPKKAHDAILWMIGKGLG